jgi:hypothetical protein
MVSRVETRNLLRSLQGSYLTAAVMCMKTTPTQALEVSLCHIPLDLAAIEAAEPTAYRENGGIHGSISSGNTLSH